MSESSLSVPRVQLVRSEDTKRWNMFVAGLGCEDIHYSIQKSGSTDFGVERGPEMSDFFKKSDILMRHSTLIAYGICLNAALAWRKRSGPTRQLVP